MRKKSIEESLNELRDAWREFILLVWGTIAERPWQVFLVWVLSVLFAVILKDSGIIK